MFRYKDKGTYDDDEAQQIAYYVKSWNKVEFLYADVLTFDTKCKCMYEPTCVWLCGFRGCSMRKLYSAE